MKKLAPVLNTIFALNILVMCISVYFVFSGVRSILNNMNEPGLRERAQAEAIKTRAAARLQAIQNVVQSTPVAAAVPQVPAPEKPAQQPVKKEKPPEVKSPEPPKIPAVKINSKTALLYDYNETNTKNSLGFESGSLAKNGGTIKYFVYKSNLPEDAGRESSLRIIFNVSASPKAYVSYFSKLEYVDISKYKQVSFYVKGSAGGETFAVAVDDGKKTGKTMLFASNEWRKVAVPFSGLNKKVNLKYFNGSISVMVENKTANIKEGSIFIDNITLE